MKFDKFGALVALVTAMALPACGGGGGGGIGGTGGTGPGGGTATGMSYGTITNFGSVWVNGVEFNSVNSAIRVDDNPGLESDLRVGMVVRVDGSISGATATAITADSALKGRVEQVLDANRMLVMGQTVRIDNQTRFENGIVPVAGDYVEVHGLVVADGVVAAGYIERKTTLATPPFAVKGLVKTHDSAARTLTVGTLSVSYPDGATIGDMPGGSWNGLQVEIKGTACSGNPVCGTLTASKVEPGGVRTVSAAQAEVEGFVSAVSASGFTLGTQPVVTSASTVFEGGVLADIAVGVKVEVEGSLSGGVLTATTVSFRDNVRLEGDVATINVAQGTLTLAGLPDLTVRVNSLTEFKNVLSLAELGAPNHLRVRGRPDGANAMVALEVEQRSVAANNRVILQGPVAPVTGTTSLTILSNVVDTSAVDESEFKNLADAPIGRAAFFAALTTGSLVKARGSLSGAGVAWDQMELED